MGVDGLRPTTPEAAARVFGERVDRAERFVDLLRRHGVERGLIGPRELDRLWERHVLNSAVLGERVPRETRVIDVGSGAGFPGVPLAIARPDLDIVLLEPMARRVDWLTEVADTLELSLTIVRGRAEEKRIREQLGTADVVTARAVAPLARLASWCLPLVRPSGVVLALKGATAAEEVDRDRNAVLRAGGGEPSVESCGAGVLETPSTVVVIERVQPRRPERARPRRSRSTRTRSR
ncbi:16S rRNA m(7)G-527 methyltransferase [Prauserella shujinwangii]|uniref:Ribosomal RNA small subunit methyltransferase G n=1 Tax=Prauserella shujinwangii TaxID=1453103 RepID=A0A2T0LV56_9PSEU|nr:16S rRNA (guanine(527)-N(7))-methyltransferase RsmG [Prauserella shujinwangii]PRX47715.1 16S rRNA m(7)G-527 methyltransferase [Prauserella shujinwangii]